MRRLFCYTLSARAIGATVSAGALHAQGWGFESLIAHHRFDRLPAMGAFPFSGPSQRDSNPQGCGAEETRKRFPAQHARAAGPKRKRAAKPHATSLIAHHRFDRLPAMGAFPFSGPSQRDSNPQGCGAEETRKRFPAQHARAAGPKRKRAAKPHATSLIAHHRFDRLPAMGAFPFSGPSQRDSNPPARLSQRLWSKNGKYEYCYFVCNI